MNSKDTELVIYKLLFQLTSQKPHPPHLDPDNLACEFYQIFKSKVKPILRTCILNVLIKVERNIPQFMLWCQYYSDAKARGQLFCRIASILVYPLLAHDEFHVLHIWQEHDGNDIVFISSHFIRCFMISMYPIVDDDHLDHLIEVVAVQLPYYQVTHHYLVINSFFVF